VRSLESADVGVGVDGDVILVKRFWNGGVFLRVIDRVDGSRGGECIAGELIKGRHYDLLDGVESDEKRCKRYAGEDRLGLVW